MKNRKKPVSKVERLLVEFSLWAGFGLKRSIENVIELRREIPREIKNPVMLFLLPYAMDHVVEKFSIEVLETWNLLNSELKRRGLRTLGKSHKDYRHLKRIRDKMVAHRLENIVKSNRYRSWYKRTYGTYESTFALIQRTADHVASRIDRLSYAGHFTVESASSRGRHKIEKEDISLLIDALKNHGIF